MDALTAPCVTRAELIRLSAFTLPAAAVRHLPKGDRAVARRVPGLTREQVRAVAYYGLFDAFQVKNSKARDWWILWKPRRRGDTSLYCTLDVMTARLVAWMRRDGLTMARIALLLRGEASARALMLSDTAESLSAWQIGRGFGGCVVPFGGSLNPGRHGREWTFPIAWLGLTTNILPRIHTLREANPNIVWRRRSLPVEQVAEMQQRTAALEASRAEQAKRRSAVS
jgi:hypothetical protein